MREVLSQVLAAFGRVLTGVLVILVVVGVLQQFSPSGKLPFGYAVVVSGSMEPNIHVNDVLVYQKHRQADYHPGDVILYIRGEGTEDEMLISHRIVSIDGDTLVTKGDANMASDAPIQFSQVVGRVAIRIPYIGRTVRFVRTVPGLIIAGLLIVGLVVFGLLLPTITRTKKAKTVMGEQTIRY